MKKTASGCCYSSQSSFCWLHARKMVLTFRNHFLRIGLYPFRQEIPKPQAINGGSQGLVTMAKPAQVA